MATQARKRNAKQGDRNVKAKRRRNAKRGEATKREGFPGRNAPSPLHVLERKELSDAIGRRSAKLKRKPSTTRTRDLTTEEAKRVRNIDRVLANKVQLHN